jgi:predicted GNAT family N-acyltransferase
MLGADRPHDLIDVRWIAAPEDLRRAIALRELVFCGEQGVPLEEEIDGLDKDARHIVAVQGEHVVGTTRLRSKAGEAKIGRVAVEREWRGRGIALRMLELAMRGAREDGCVSARLAAQVQATGVYERAGFTIESELFVEAGIDHVWMGRSLTSAD